MAPSVSPPPSKRRRIIDGNIERTPDAGHTTTQEPSGLRIFSWNINGIKPFLQPSLHAFLRRKDGASSHDSAMSNSLRGFLKRHNWPHVLNLQEVKIAPTDAMTLRGVESAVNSCRQSGPDSGPSYVVRFCLPRDKHNATGFGRKVHGVATIIREDFYNEWVASVREVDWDQEGRVIIVETTSKIAILNVYAVNGTEAPLKDSLTGKIIGTRHDRKLHFHKLLLQDCKALETSGFTIVLCGDLNVASQAIDGHPRLRTVPIQHAKNRADFNDKFFLASDGLRAVDSFRFLHPDLRLYSWMSRNKPWLESCDRVDYILLSRGKEPALRAADVLMSASERGPSDHFPIYVELDMSLLNKNIPK